MAETTAMERQSRHRPGTGTGGAGLDDPMMLELPLKLVAPGVPGKANTLHLETGVEIKLLSDRGKPIANERCQLFKPDGSIVEKKTDAQGVVRFTNLPVLFNAQTSFQDVIEPGLVLPDILEEWRRFPPGNFGKNKGERDDYRKRDGSVHFVPTGGGQVEIKLNALSEEEKFQHFVEAYMENNARYEASNPREYNKAEARWNWGKGAVCNQHVNFFLGYWFNYNGNFTTAGSATAMMCLPLYNSDKHNFPPVHRGYMELLDPVLGFGTALRVRYTPGDPSTAPAPAQYNQAYQHVEYIRMSRYLDGSTGAPFDTRFIMASADAVTPASDWTRMMSTGKLIDALGTFNVYSLSDIKPAARPGALKATRAWLKQHKATNGLTDAQIAGKTDAQLWELIWHLDDGNVEDAKLLKSLRKLITWDHHAGILLKRAKGGGPLTGAEGEEVELWTFSADGAHTPGPPIVLKRYADVVKGSKFQHLAIWKLKPLRPGGFAPASAEGNAGGISVDEPPRFIHWK